MTTCVNIVINIQNFIPGIIYIGYVRPYGSIIDFNTYPQYSKLAFGPQIVFDGLEPLQFEVGLQKDCGKGNLSEILWMDPVTLSCIAPTATFAGTTFTIGIPTATSGYEWRMDEGDWVKVNSNGTSTHSLTLATINATTANYESLRPNALIDFQFRTYCSSTEHSSIYHYYRVATPTALPSITLVKTLCSGSTFTGQKLRMTMAQNTVAAENLVYHDPGGDVSLSNYTRTNNMDTDIDFYKTLLTGTNSIRSFNTATPQTAIAVSFDFISKESPFGINYTGTVNCGPYPVKYQVL